MYELKCVLPKPQREHRAQLSWDCQEELFRQEVENADDIRLSMKLFKVMSGM